MTPHERTLTMEIERLQAQVATLQYEIGMLHGGFKSFNLPGETARLSASENKIAKIMHDNKGAVVPRDRLYDVLYALRPNDGPHDKVIDVMICKIRSKISKHKIVTFWGRWYQMVDA